MKLKKVRKICMVKGCRNVDCYTLTASREFGQSVIMCGACIKAAAAEIERLEKTSRDVATEVVLSKAEEASGGVKKKGTAAKGGKSK